MPGDLDKDTRDGLLTMSDTRLLRLCRVDSFRGSGRGGQKRNVTDSAVRVTHLATGVNAVSDRTRSQQRNRGLALRALRMEIALTCRAEPPEHWDGTWAPARRSSEYPVWVAVLLDVLERHRYRVSDAAHFFGVSTGRCVKDLAADPKLWQRVNNARRNGGLPPLKRH